MSDNLLLRSVSRPHGFEPRRVEGKIPEGLRGTLYRAGPGLFERFGKQLSHPFEADGAISAVRFTDEGASTAVRLVESAGYKEEEEAGKFLYNSAAPWLARVRAALSGQAKTTGNTSTFFWQDRLFALMEGGLAQEMDPRTLDTLGIEDFGVVKTAFSAHPHRVAALRTSFNFGVRYGKKMFIDLYALPDRGAVRKLGTLEAPWMSMVHDFIATERHLVFFLGPVELVLWRALLGLADFNRLFRYRPELGSRFLVVPLDDVAHPKTIELEPFWAWHFVNARDSVSGVELEICRYEDFTSLQEIGSTNETSLPHWDRLELDLKSGKSTLSAHSEYAVEFPQVHPRVQGGAHQLFFAQTRDSRGDAVSRVDRSGASTSWIVPVGHSPSEPVLVPRSEVEDDVWVLNLVLDAGARTSYLAVLDGQRLSEGPVARVYFEQAIPVTFHGSFVSST